MRERPILFSAPMVRAILEGRKTVTRRLVKPAPYMQEVAGTFGGRLLCFPDRHNKGRGLIWPNAKEAILAQCPYGHPGDRLWVRESLGYDAEWGHYFKVAGAHGQVTYLCELFDDPEAETGPSYDDSLPDRGVPSIHLPRRYSRITLEVTGVRVERLQDITYESALAEGAMDGARFCEAMEPGKRNELGESNEYVARRLEWPQRDFRNIWESINGDGSWDVNPWVWAIEFRRIEQERKAA